MRIKCPECEYVMDAWNAQCFGCSAWIPPQEPTNGRAPPAVPEVLGRRAVDLSRQGGNVPEEAGSEAPDSCLAAFRRVLGSGESEAEVER